MILLILNFVSLFSQEKPAVKDRIFSPAELHTDLDSMYIWINATHPDLYFNLKKEVADKNWEEVRKKINKPMKKLEFARLISPLITQYQDGHLNLGAYFWEDEEFQNYSSGGGKFFPLQVKIKSGKIFVVKGDTANNIHPGSEIMKINKVSASNIIQHLLTQIPADTKKNAEASISRLFNTTLWYVYGWGSQSNIEYRNPSKNEILTANLTGISFEEVLKYNFPKGNKKMDLLIFEPDKLAVIETFGLINNKDTKKFLDSAFTEIKKQNIRTVAVDIRRNGGGSSAVGNEILKYLTKTNYTQAARSEKLKSDYLLSKPYNQWILNMFEKPEYKEAMVNNRLVFQNEALVEPNLEKPELFFEGNFYLLTGPQTFSSAHMLAAAVKAYELGEIIGESTGSRMVFFGEPAIFYLPNTKIYGTVPTVKHWMPGYTDENLTASIEPDVTIEILQKDLAQEKDPVLEYLKSVAAHKN